MVLEDTIADDPERADLNSRALGDVDEDWWHVRQQLLLGSVINVVLALVAVFSMAVARGA